MADTQYTIGADLTPFEQKMAQVTALAKSTGAKVGESLGLEGLKGERGLKTSITGFFKDIAGGADIATAATSRLSDSFRMSGATLVAVAAVQYLYGAMEKGFEIAGKFRDAVKESLTISSDSSAKSVEQMDEEIAELKEAAKATDLQSMNDLERGATVVAQAFEKGESISKVINEDAQEHLEIVQKERAEQDAAASQSIDQENEILRLKIAGNDAQADALRDELADRNKLIELQRQGDEGAIAALQEQIALKAQLRDEDGQKKSAKLMKDQEDKVQDQINRTNQEAAEEERKAAFDQLSTTQKIKALQDQIAAAKKLERDPFASPLLKAQSRLSAAQANDQLLPLQRDVAKATEKSAKKPLTPAEIDRMIEKQGEDKDRLSSLRGEEAAAKSKLSEAQADAMGFHGQVSSLRKVGFGRAPSGGGADAKQLKAVQEQKAVLDKIEKSISELNNKIGGSA